MCVYNTVQSMGAISHDGDGSAADDDDDDGYRK